MKRLLRPLFVITLASFILGLWYSLQKVEMNLLAEIKEPPQVNLLTYFRDPWQKVHLSIPFLIRVNHPQNADLFEQVLRGMDQGCDVVELDSLTLRYFIENRLIKPWNMEKLKNAHLVSADFRTLPSDPNGKYLFPLFWTMAQWRKLSEFEEPENLSELLSQPNWKKKVRISTPIEDQLTVALDLGLISSEVEADGEGEILPDMDEPVKVIHQQFLLKPPANENDRKGLHIERSLITGANAQTDSRPIKSSPQLDFWVKGLGLCANSKNESAAHAFLDSLLEDPAYFELVRTSPYAATLTTGEHQDLAPTMKASFLRSVELARIQQRELPWALMRPWLKKLAPEGSSVPKAD